MVHIDGCLFGSDYFPNQEVVYKEVSSLSHDNVHIISLRFEDTRDIATVLMATQYLRDEYPDSQIILDIWYLPYSAMDRKINNQLFSLKYIANIINSQGYSAVRVFDPHNISVTSELIKNFELVSIESVIRPIISDYRPDVFYFPDVGARKYIKFLHGIRLPYVYGEKIRNLSEHGHITSYRIIADGKSENEIHDMLSGKRVLIIDDICRKGSTFYFAAQELRKYDTASIGLYVSHCESGIFNGKVLTPDSGISVVYTTDSEPGFISRLEKDKFNDIQYGRCKLYKISNS